MDSFPGGDHVVFLGAGRPHRAHRAPAAGVRRRPLPRGAAARHGPLRAEQGHNIARLQAVRMATRALVDLSDELDETLGLGVWGNQGPTIVRWEEASQPVSDNLRTGLVLPVLTSATGLAFAAWLPPERHRALHRRRTPAGRERQAFPRSRGAATSSWPRSATTASCAWSAPTQFADLYGGSISAISVPVFDAAAPWCWRSPPSAPRTAWTRARTGAW